MDEAISNFWVSSRTFFDDEMIAAESGGGGRKRGEKKKKEVGFLEGFLEFQ